MFFTSVDTGYPNVLFVYIIPIDIYLVNEKYCLYYLKKTRVYDTIKKERLVDLRGVIL